jgi:hypothetical protein
MLVCVALLTVLDPLGNLSVILVRALSIVMTVVFW